MRLLAAVACVKLLRQANHGGVARPELRATFADDLHRSAAVARLIGRLLGGEQDVFLWVREFGIWPSSENWDLFYSLRGGSDERDARLADKPGHVMGPEGYSRFVSLLQVVLLNGWGGVLVGLRSGQRIGVSHDSWLSIRASAMLPEQRVAISGFALPSRMDAAPQSLVDVPESGGA